MPDSTMEFERLARLGEQIGTAAREEPPPPSPALDPFPELSPPSPLRTLARACKVLAVPLLLGIGFRLLLIPLTSWSKDDSIWWLASANGMQHLGLYQRIGYSYPPLWGDLLQGLGWIFQHVGLQVNALGSSHLSLAALSGGNEFSTIVTSPLFNWCFKSLLLVFDLGTGLLLYEIVRRSTFSERKARWAFCFWFLNPFVIFETGVFGAFDVLVAFTVLATIALFLSERYVWAGATLGIAIMAKGSPAFLVPFFAFVAFDRGGDTVTARLRSVVPFLSGLAAALAAFAIPLWGTGQLHNAFNALFVRTGNGRAGGYSIFGLLDFRGFQGLGNSINNWSGFGRLILSLQAISAILLGLLGARRARRDTTFAAVSTVALVLVTVVMLGPIANTQYALWFLPELLILSVLWRRGTWGVIAFSLAALAFVLTLYGPAALIFPLVARHDVSANATTQTIFSWINMPALPWSTGVGNVNFDGPITVLALTGFVSVLRALLWLPVPRRRRLGAAFGAAGGGTVPILGVTLAAALLGTGIASAASASGSVFLSATTSSRQLTVTADVRPGPSLQSLRLVSFPTAAARSPDNVDIYVDSDYPVNGTTKIAVANVAQTLMNDLRLHGFHGAVRTVDANQLRMVLNNRRSAPGTEIVDMSGILPAQVFSAHTDLVSPWLHAGGTLYWGGAAIGEFSGRPGELENQSSYPGSLGSAGVAHFIAPAQVQQLPQPYHVGTVASPTAKAFKTIYQFNFLAPITNPSDPNLSGMGWSSADRASVSRVAQGRGQVVIFGGLIYNQALVVPDLRLMIMTGMTKSNGPFSSVSVPQHIVEHGGLVRWRVPAASSPERTVVIAFDPSDAGLVLSRWSGRH